MNIKNILLGLLIVVVFAVGFMVGRFSSVGSTYIAAPSSESTDTTTDDIEKDTNTDGNDSEEATTGEVAAENTTIQASSLSDGQKKLLGALGIDADSITVTPEMMACAEASLGAPRIDEIIDGATPSFSEGLKLAACYK